MISINIAGAFTFNFQLYFLKKNTMLKKYNVSLYDGVNLCKWNGGRINRDINIQLKDIEKYNKMGISIGLTFTNHNIDLTDKKGLRLLEWLNYSQKKYNVINTIILINEEFRVFLRENYNFKLKYSITGHDLPMNMDKEIAIEYYKDLENKYDVIVPKMEHVFKSFFTDLSKYELMTNDTCSPDCQYYREHFIAIADENTKQSSYEETKIVEECWLKTFNPDNPITNQIYGMDFTKDMIKKSIQLGFTKFKISGRENQFEDVISDLQIL